MDCIIAIEGGTTASRGGRFTSAATLVQEATAGPSNPAQYGLDESIDVILELAHKLVPSGGCDIVAAGVSGSSEPRFRNAIADALSQALDVKQVKVTNDVQALLAANAPDSPAILVIAGTGSSVLLQDSGLNCHLNGGRGPVIGDNGSAYSIAVAGLKAAAYQLDGGGPETALVQAIPTALGLENFRAVSGWIGTAQRHAIAGLARVVDEAASAMDGVARNCISDQADRLARQVQHAFFEHRMPPAAPVLTAGGVFEHSELFTTTFKESLRVYLPGSAPIVPQYRGIHAVARLALSNTASDAITVVEAENQSAVTPTEAQLDSLAPIDQLTPLGIVKLMHAEDERAVAAVGREAPAIAALVERAAQAVSSSGRIVYVGSGTSGRLGALDAAECPPTFGVSPDRVVALIAGGADALMRSIEGAEDDRDQGVIDLQNVTPVVGSKDVVIGISASGTAPYVHGALEAAKELGAVTAVISCNPRLETTADYRVVVNTGAEAVTGSTRLKAGTAAKLVLNMISTGAMALSGFVYNGQMVEMRPVNSKLRKRATAIVSKLANVDVARAEQLLADAKDRIALAVVMGKLNLDAEGAGRKLEQHGGTLRGVMDAE